MTKVFVTGATGYIGKRLIAALLSEGHEVYALSRVKGLPVFQEQHPNLHVISGDLRECDHLEGLPADITVAYYLVHSMSDIMSGLLATEERVARNFIKVVQGTHLRQIVYLGGIIDEHHLSEHLQARLLVEGILKDSGIPTTILRASIIVGAGSASFEIIRDLVEKLPAMVAPRWISNKLQPIAIKDVLYYLTHVLLMPETFGRTFDIGGPDVLTFKQAMMAFAHVRHLKRIIITVPLLTPRLSSYWLVLVTSVKFSLASYLVDSMQANTICHDDAIRSVIPHTCSTYEEAIRAAFSKIDQNAVLSTWMDAWETDVPNPDLQKFVEVPKDGILVDRRVVAITGDVNKVMDNIWSIGGDRGWYSMNWAWKLRGLMDKLIGGIGLNRGRRHPYEIQPGDSIDFWRVLKADRSQKQLILYAEMKVPGEAWLEFSLEDTSEGPRLIQTATFRPRGIFGRLYWYGLLPFHLIIFRSMANNIAKG